MTNAQNDYQVARTIYNQIGKKAFYMLGAKDIVLCDDALQFGIGRNASKINKIRVEFDRGSDTYTIQFFNIRGLSIKDMGEATRVYADSMHQVIEEKTGMYTSL